MSVLNWKSKKFYDTSKEILVLIFKYGVKLTINLINRNITQTGNSNIFI